MLILPTGGIELDEDELDDVLELEELVDDELDEVELDDELELLELDEVDGLAYAERISTFLNVTVPEIAARSLIRSFTVPAG